MNVWLWAALAFSILLVPCGAAIIRVPLNDALVTLQFATSIAVLILTLVAIGFQRPSFLDIALTLALLAYPASMLFAHFFERWL